MKRYAPDKPRQAPPPPPLHLQDNSSTEDTKNPTIISTSPPAAALGKLNIQKQTAASDRTDYAILPVLPSLLAGKCRNNPYCTCTVHVTTNPTSKCRNPMSAEHSNPAVNGRKSPYCNHYSTVIRLQALNLYMLQV